MSLPENIDKAIKAFGSACSACGSSDWHGSDEDASEASARYVATDEALRAAIRTRLAAAEGLLRHAQDWIGMALKSMPPNSRRDTLPFLKDIAAHFTPAPATGHDAKED